MTGYDIYMNGDYDTIPDRQSKVDSYVHVYETMAIISLEVFTKR